MAQDKGSDAGKDVAKGKPTLTLLQGELGAAAPAAPEPTPDTAKDASDSGRGRDDRLTRSPRGEIFENCPVQPLGVNGAVYYYLDVLGQLQAVDNHSKDRISAVFGGRTEALTAHFPSFGRSGNVTGWSQEGARAAMQRACSDKGVWNAFERVRGLGAWRDEDGGVILHCGDAILYHGVWRTPGEIDGFVYPSFPRIPKPLQEFATHGDGSSANTLLDTLSTWNWARGDIDAYLALGWICGALFGGALDWRPLIWMTGDAGTGKSTLQKLLRYVMGGEGAILQSTDPTEAGIRQTLMQSTIPVALDEVEAETDGRKLQSIIKLARQAASGGVVLRGGADHKGQEFRARSSFAFSSILVPALLDQDISRIALLELLPLERGTAPPAIEEKFWLRVGRGLRTAVLDSWPRLHETMEAYRSALARAGHSARGCDQFGTLLAMADLALSNAPPTPTAADEWASKLSAATINEQTDQSADWQRCLNHLFGQPVDLYRSGERLSVGRWVLIAAGYLDEETPQKAERALSSVGMRIYGHRDTAQLAIANSHAGLALLFQGTQWYAPAAQSGVWAQATKRVPGAESVGPLRFDMVASRARKFPLRAIPHLFGEDGLSKAAMPPETPPAYTADDFV